MHSLPTYLLSWVPECPYQNVAFRAMEQGKEAFFVHVNIDRLKSFALPLYNRTWTVENDTKGSR